MALGPVNIAPLQERLPIVDKEGRPMTAFIRSINKTFQQLARAFNDQADIVQQLAELAGIVDAQGEIIDAQQEQIDELAAAQEEGASALSLQNSGVVNEAGNLTAISSGNVTIANHSRLYGNQTLNPTVALTGDTLVTGEASGTTVYIFYDDPTRAGGAVTYQYSTDSADVAQTGSRHSVGYVEIPAGPTATGTYTRPR